MTLNVSEDATASKINNNDENQVKALKLENLASAQNEGETENPLITKTTIIIPPDGGWGWMVMVS